MDNVTISCPRCDFEKKVPKDKIPKKDSLVNCPKCKTPFVVGPRTAIEFDFDTEPDIQRHFRKETPISSHDVAPAAVREKRKPRPDHSPKGMSVSGRHRKNKYITMIGATLFGLILFHFFGSQFISFFKPPDRPDYPAEVVESYMNKCAPSGSAQTRTFCKCMIDTIQREYTIEDYNNKKKGPDDAALFEIEMRCKSKNNMGSSK